ncbi:MAG: OsmC family protein [Cytophagales bacterium]
MATAKAEYLGELRTTAKHLQSGTEIITDAPTDNMGKGEAFSPTDLVATALGTCMLTTIGIVANRHQWELAGMKMEITKVMSSEPPRKISEIHIRFNFAGIKLTDEQQIIIKNTALTCPVARSLDENIKQVVDFGF